LLRKLRLGKPPAPGGFFVARLLSVAAA